MNSSTSHPRAARIAASIVAIVLATMLPWAPAASAYQHVLVSGQAGAVQPYATLGVHLKVPCGVPGYYNCNAPALVVSGPEVYRSPASTGTQYVTANYYVFGWDGGAWVAESVKTFSGSIASWQTGVALPAWSVLPRTGGYKSTAFEIQWSDSAGRILGTSIVAMNGNDYDCRTRFTDRCTAYHGSIVVLRP